MSASHIASGNGSVARRLTALAELYQQGQASELTERVLAKLLAYEAEVVRKQLAQIQADLEEFEGRYQQPSAVFYERYQAGQTDDRMDFVEWASLVQMANNLAER